MIRIRLVIFLLILEGLLRKGFRPKQWVFWCIVSRESGVSYPVEWVYRIPCRCIVSREMGVSYPVLWCIVSRENGRSLSSLWIT